MPNIFKNEKLESLFPQISILKEINIWNKSQLQEWELLSIDKQEKRINTAFESLNGLFQMEYVEKLQEFQRLNFPDKETFEFMEMAKRFTLAVFNILYQADFNMEFYSICKGLNPCMKLALNLISVTNEAISVDAFLTSPAACLAKKLYTLPNNPACEYYKNRIMKQIEALDQEINFKRRLEEIPFAKANISLDMLFMPAKQSGVRIALMTTPEFSALKQADFEDMSQPEQAMFHKRRLTDSLFS